MSDTKQLTILKRLTALLERINPVDDPTAEFDLRGRVFRGRTIFGDEEAPPFVSILESLRPDPTPAIAGYDKLFRSEQWELLIQGWAATDPANPVDALYELKGALEKQLSRVQATNPVPSSDYRLGNNLIIGIRIGPGVVRALTPQTGSREALYLPVLIEYMSNVSDPWAL